jgi:SAM-dependent methyltransferase
MARIPTIRSIIDSNVFSLSAGSKETRLCTINIDIHSFSGNVDIVASVLHLPFHEDCFQQVLFADVIEHLHEGLEETAIKELAYVLKPQGKLILTTPNYTVMFITLDPAWWLIRHRHYTRARIKGIIQAAGLRVEREGTFGSPSEALKALVMYFTYPLKLIIGRYPMTFHGCEIDPLRQDDAGHTRFIIASKYSNTSNIQENQPKTASSIN